MKRNVLIVEDDPTMRVVLKRTLMESSIELGEVYEAENGKIGLDMLGEYDIDLMLVDIYMPVMDGMEMLDYAAEHPEWRNIPAVVVSTENDEKRIDAILRRGMGFVHKEFTSSLLEDQIMEKLKSE
ncbi:response regulator [Rhodohalobacter sp. SW132]|uniref:response regulator n=1 Tax=Rhodohalobacter sp. SW132 TaxID=2293433 RepID=UPI000E22E1BF|nr:response regulator [Rhodohalobacter sp. SW132]REL38702.1 response regulator [Rhodohalobacter sp. SW132]